MVAVEVGVEVTVVDWDDVVLGVARAIVVCNIIFGVVVTRAFPPCIVVFAGTVDAAVEQPSGELAQSMGASLPELPEPDPDAESSDSVELPLPLLLLSPAANMVCEDGAQSEGALHLGGGAKMASTRSAAWADREPNCITLCSLSVMICSFRRLSENSNPGMSSSSFLCLAI